jgi:hypothetical protein
MATKIARPVPLGFLSVGLSEELGILRDDMGSGQPVVPGEENGEVWGGSVASICQPE